jgi:hypothetical protein
MSRGSSSHLMISIGARAYLPRRYVTRAVRVCKARGALNANKTCGQSDCRTAPAQHRPAARTQYVATVRSGSTTLGSRAATVSSDLTTRCRAGHASDVARRDGIHAVEGIIHLP